MIQLNVTGKLNLHTVLLDSSLNVHTGDERDLQTTYLIQTNTNWLHLFDYSHAQFACEQLR
jgi:hypothetical protein